MQAKLSSALSVPERLERLRVHTQSTWDQVGERIGIKRAMIQHVKRGARQLSTKTLYRLHAAEVEAGLARPFSPAVPPRSAITHDETRIERARRNARVAREIAEVAEANLEEVERMAARGLPSTADTERDVIEITAALQKLMNLSEKELQQISPETFERVRAAARKLVSLDRKAAGRRAEKDQSKNK